MGAMWWDPGYYRWLTESESGCFHYMEQGGSLWLASKRIAGDYEPGWIKRPTTESKTMKEEERFKYFGELLLRMSEGEDLHYLGEPVKYWPDLNSDPDDWTTVKKVHPLQCLVGTQILCEFDNGPKTHCDRYWLDGIEPDYDNPFVTEFDAYKRCTPVLDYWNDWSGGECPVPAGMEFQLRLRDDTLIRGTKVAWDYHGDFLKNVIAVMYLEDS